MSAPMEARGSRRGPHQFTLAKRFAATRDTIMLELTKRECTLLRLLLTFRLEEIERDGGARGDTLSILYKVQDLEEKMNAS